MTWPNERRAIGEHCKGLLFPDGEKYKREKGKKKRVSCCLSEVCPGSECQWCPTNSDGGF